MRSTLILSILRHVDPLNIFRLIINYQYRLALDIFDVCFLQLEPCYGNTGLEICHTYRAPVLFVRKLLTRLSRVANTRAGEPLAVYQKPVSPRELDHEMRGYVV